MLYNITILDAGLGDRIKFKCIVTPSVNNAMHCSHSLKIIIGNIAESKRFRQMTMIIRIII